MMKIYNLYFLNTDLFYTYINNNKPILSNLRYWPILKAYVFKDYQGYSCSFYELNSLYYTKNALCD